MLVQYVYTLYTYNTHRYSCRYLPTGILTVYSGFRAPGPDCQLHTAITYVIKVLEPQSSREFQWQLARELSSSSTINTWVIAVCNGQTGPETLKQLHIYIICSLNHVIIVLDLLSSVLIANGIHVSSICGSNTLLT